MSRKSVGTLGAAAGTSWFGNGVVGTAEGGGDATDVLGVGARAEDAEELLEESVSIGVGPEDVGVLGIF